MQYIAEYTMENGDLINGGMEKWTDPTATNLAYSDGATTTIYKAPTDLTRNGSVITDDSVIFKGFRLVYNAGTDSAPDWKPMEIDENGDVIRYYHPGDIYTVLAANANNGYIYLQAVYQEKESSDMRPHVTNLILDANAAGGLHGYINAGYADIAPALPSWVYPGVHAVNTGSHLDGNNPTQILFGDIQSSAAVHLYKYATDAGAVKADGYNYFTHPNGYFLLGFDDNPEEGDYAATYTADGVIGVERQPIDADPQIVYAVWEPMVYVTFVNKTGVTANNVTFGLSSADSDALVVINVKKGMYERTRLSDFGNLTLANNESITLAFPKGAEKVLTVSGTNNLGVGKVLQWNTSIDLVEDDVSTVYSTNHKVYPGPDTNTTAPNSSYSHTVGTNEHEHALASGEALNTKSFTFDETMVTNKNALTVTFTSRNNDYALQLDDNYTGGGMQEFDYGLDDIQPNVIMDGDTIVSSTPKEQQLPTTSTRIGYSFLGWAYSKDATEPDFSASKPADKPWTIPDLNKDNGFFRHDQCTEIDGVMTRTLYAVWEARTDAVYVYKDVPAPGNQTKSFTFTLGLGGTFKHGYNGGQSETINESHDFILKHGEYLKVNTSNYNTAVNIGQYSTAYMQAEVKVYSPVEIDGVITYEEDTTRSHNVRWEKTDVYERTSNRFEDPRVFVTEQSETYYDTTVTLSSEANDNELLLGSYNTGQSYSKDELPKTLPVNGTYWENITNAGGTVIFTNQRQTHDITVRKDLTSNTGAATSFGFTASYVDEDITTTLPDFNVFSGGSMLLEDIPAGAKLNLTEVTDANDNYKTNIRVETSSNNTVEGYSVTGGKSTIINEVDDDYSVIFENTLKSYPVTFKLVDQDGNPLHAMFAMASSVGSVFTEHYAGEGGIFYTSDEFWCDTYTLNQTTTPTGYISLKGTPVTLNVTGIAPYITSDNSWVTVEAVDNNDPTKGFVIIVKNWAQETVTVKKVLNDPLLSSTRTFNFTYSYISPLDGSTVSDTFTLAPLANNAAGITRDLIIPVNATNLVITEQTTDAYEVIGATYNTVDEGVWANNGNSTAIVDGDESETVFKIAAVTDDATVTFTNTRKTVDITVIKQVEGTGNTFNFTALLQNGSNGIASYTLNNKGTEGDTTDDIVTDTNGSAGFALTPATNNKAQIVLTIPYGSKLTLTEASLENYRPTTQVETGEVTSGLEVILNAADTVKNLTVTFTNKEVYVAPTGVTTHTNPYIWILFLGGLLALTALPVWYRRRKEDET